MEINKMIRARFLHLAEIAILEKRNNSLSMIRFIDGFQGVSFPFVAPNFSIVLRTEKEGEGPDSAEFELIMRQQENELFKNKMKVNYEEKTANHLVVEMRGMMVKEPSPIEIIFSGFSLLIISLMIAHAPKQEFRSNSPYSCKVDYILMGILL